MASRLAPLLSMAWIALAAGGCASSTARFYTLDSTATAVDAPPAHYTVLVGPVSVPPSVDRPQFVVQVAPNRVDVNEFNRWVAPLNDAIARAVAGDLAVLLGTPDVAMAPLANFNPAYRVTIDVQRFESIQGEAAIVDAAWAVRTTAGDTQSGRTVAREAVQGNDFGALAAAHSRALAKVSSDIAAVIRTAADTDSRSPPVPSSKPETRNKSKTARSKGQSK